MPLPELYRNITFAAQTDESEIVTFQGTEHLVVPVTALVGGVVIRPHGSKGPELVPASVLKARPRMWNQRPITYNHPSDGKKLINIETPEVFDKFSWGSIWYPRFADNGLKFKLYLSKDRAEVVGAMDLYNDALARRAIGVSVGCAILVREESGVSESGQAYEYVWEEIVNTDHLALLPAGYVGACDTGDGCGVWLTLNKEISMAAETESTTEAPPVEESQPTTEPVGATNETVEPITETITEPVVTSTDAEVTAPTEQAFRNERLVSATELRAAATADDGIGLWELWYTLANIVYNVEPAFGSIQEVFLGSQTVVYSTYRNNNYELWRRAWAVDESWQVSVSDQVESVQYTGTYTTVQEVQMSDPTRQAGINPSLTIRPANATNEPAPATRQAATPCSCQSSRTTQAAANPNTITIPTDLHEHYIRAATRERERENQYREQLISAIVAAGTGETRETLATLATNSLESMERLARVDYGAARLSSDTASSKPRDGYSKLRAVKSA